MDESKVQELKAIQQRSLSGFVCKELEEMILSGQLEPGSRINESELARNLKVSRGPIREACRLLEKSGLVEFRPNIGTFIQKIDRQDLSELYDIRAALDALAGEKAAERFQASDLATLTPLIEEMESLVKKEDAKNFFDVNLKFHLSIIKISGNRRLYDMYESNHKKTTLFRKAFITNKVWLKKSLDQHKKILTALTQNNPKKAAEAARSHVLSDKSESLSVVTKSLA